MMEKTLTELENKMSSNYILYSPIMDMVPTMMGTVIDGMVVTSIAAIATFMEKENISEKIITVKILLTAVIQKEME